MSKRTLARKRVLRLQVELSTCATFRLIVSSTYRLIKAKQRYLGFPPVTFKLTDVLIKAGMVNSGNGSHRDSGSELDTGEITIKPSVTLWRLHED